MKGKIKYILISILIGLITLPAIALGGSFAISLIQGKTPEESIQILTEQIDSLIGRTKELEEKQSKMEAQLAIITSPIPAPNPAPTPAPSPVPTPIPTPENNPSPSQPANIAASPLDNLKPVTDQDHILGNSDAPVTIVLFADLECPFCRRFYATMKQIMDEYGKAGKVKWVFRELPLVQLHSKSKNEAVAAECAVDLGGNEVFWRYVDRLFEITPSNNGLDPEELPKIAEYIGLDKTQFETCLASGKFDQLIDEEVRDGMNSGAMGTPYAVVLGPDGKKTAIPGALPYDQVKVAIDDMLMANMPLSAPVSTSDQIGEKLFVASKNGTKYHYPWCSGAQTIKEENKIWFSSKEEAEKAGYSPAENCKGL